MNKDEQAFQTLVDKVMALSVTWIDQLEHAVTEATVLEYTKGQLSRHFEMLSGGDFLRIQRYLNDHGLLLDDRDTDMHAAVYDSLWNTIEIELSKLYA
jgi:hypothetical protein